MYVACTWSAVRAHVCKEEEAEEEYLFIKSPSIA